MPKQDIVQVVLPGGQIKAIFIEEGSNISDLVDEVLKEDGEDIRKRVVVNFGDPHSLDPGRWAIQRVLTSGPSRSWTDEELENLEHGASSVLVFA